MIHVLLEHVDRASKTHHQPVQRRASRDSFFFHHGTVSVSHMARNVSHTRSLPPPAAAAPPSPRPPRLLLASLIPAGHTEAPALNTPGVEEGD